MGESRLYSMFNKINIRASLVTLVVLTEVLFYVLSNRIVDAANADIEIAKQSIGGIDGSKPLLEMLHLNGLYRGLCAAELINESHVRMISESCVLAKNNAQQQLLSSAFDLDRELWRKAAEESDPLRFYESVNEWNSLVTSKLDQIYRVSGLIIDPDPSRHSLAEMYSILLPRLVDKTGIIRGQHAFMKAQILGHDVFNESKTLVHELQSRVKRSLQLLTSNGEYDDLKLRFIKIAANLQRYTKDLEASHSGKRAELVTDKDLNDLFLQGTEIINDLASFADEVESQLKFEFGERLRLHESALFNKYMILLLVQVTLISIYLKLFWLIRTQAEAVQRAEMSASALAVSVRELREERVNQAQMLSVVSHELRTPLASTDMIYKELDQNNLDQYLPTLKANSETVLSIMDDLRMVIRPDQIQVKERTTDLPALVIDRTLLSLANLAEQHEIKTHLSFDALSKQKMRFSTSALRQVVTNLTKNAILHSGGKNVWVGVQTSLNQSDKARVTVSIEDDGMGISPDFRETMYEAFSRGNTSADGTGLGLYIIKELAAALDGNIEYFESSRGGAGFKLVAELELPAVEKTPEPPKFTEEQLNQTLSGKRVLFAEDQLTIQMLTKNVLTKAGAEVAVASNGQIAMEAYSEARPEIVITDAMMPEMDGYQLSSRLREDGYTGPIIAVTAATIGDERDRLIAAGADVVLSKPMNIDELKLALANWEQNREQA